MKCFTAAVTALVVLCLALLVRSQAGPCDTTSCQLPNCRCSTTDTPGGLSPESVPQFVLLTFDDAISTTNFPYYESLTQRYTNPNGCSVPMTFFLLHPWTDYSLVSKLYQYGHEIASHSVTHKDDQSGYWAVLSREGWAQEISDMKTMIATYAQIPLDSITGFRAPYLQLGGDNMYGALSDSGFEYDCSWPTNEYTPWYTGGGEPKGTLWPYTLDYASVQEQTAGVKPTGSFPGLWVNPMTAMQDNIGWGCSMVDGCHSSAGELDQSEDAVLDLLKRNFDTNYYGARAPYGVYMHYYWFQADATNGNTAHTGGFERFLDYVTSFPDVYVVTVQQLLDWTRNPVPLEDIGSFLQCPPRPNTCPTVTACHYTGDLPVGSEVWMSACLEQCPASFPWLGNPYGNP